MLMCFVCGVKFVWITSKRNARYVNKNCNCLLTVPVFASLISLLLRATIFTFEVSSYCPLVPSGLPHRSSPLPPAIPLLTQNFVKDNSKISSLTHVKVLSEILLSTLKIL